MSITVLSLVERGWQAARECSLDLERRGIEVLHLIKGRVDPDVLALITPVPNSRLMSIPRTLFWCVAWSCWLWLLLRGRLRIVLVDNQRSLERLYWWAQFTHVQLMMVRPGNAGYEVWARERRLPSGTWCEVIGDPCGSR